MTVTFEAVCPTCGRDATWTTRNIPGALHDQAEHTITCLRCDKAAA